jgi:hypothetical protein
VSADKKQSKPLMVRRVAGDRGQGAGCLYAFRFAEIGSALSLTALDVAQLVSEKKLEPLHLVELARLRKHGTSAAVLAALPIDRRPTVVSDVVVATPPDGEAPSGLDTLWALTYADIADQVGLAANTVRSAAKGAGKSLDIRSLDSILDYIDGRHPDMVSS